MQNTIIAADKERGNINNNNKKDIKFKVIILMNDEKGKFLK